MEKNERTGSQWLGKNHQPQFTWHLLTLLTFTQDISKHHGNSGAWKENKSWITYFFCDCV